MVQTLKSHKDTELSAALKRSRRAFIGVGIFSAVINLLMLTGPLYMLQVYDRVLLSRSMSTLVALSVLMAGLYVFMGLLEFIRSRVLVRIGLHIEEDLGQRTFEIYMKQGQYGKDSSRARPLDDLTTVKSFLSGPAPGALFDIPWAPIFIAVVWMLHWTLGAAALAGAIIIFIVATLNELTTRKALLESRAQLMQSRAIAESSYKQSDSVTAMGMSQNIMARWNVAKQESANLHLTGSDRAGGYSATTKAFRMFLQSAILGLGCALAVVQIITPGAMIAASIIMGRALAPIQIAIGQWKGFINARGAYERLNDFYVAAPDATQPLQLLEPTGHITVKNVSAGPPEARNAILHNLNFELKAGQGIGVIGPSASGKSTLAKLLVGIWTPQRGSVRLNGATFEQWDRNILGPHIGYLSQDVALFDGTIKENIARFDPQATDGAIIEAAKNAAVHEMILQMPDGYETLIGQGQLVLSGGQVQRIALARALYGNPKLIVLDEPNANLDAEGDKALTNAIAASRKRGATVIVMTHRPSAIAAVDMLLMLRAGKIEAFGPKDKVLKSLKDKNKAQKQPTPKKKTTPQPVTTPPVSQQAVSPWPAPQVRAPLEPTALQIRTRDIQRASN